MQFAINHSVFFKPIVFLKSILWHRDMIHFLGLSWSNEVSSNSILNQLQLFDLMDVFYFRLHQGVCIQQSGIFQYRLLNTYFENLVVHSQLFKEVWLPCKCYGGLWFKWCVLCSTLWVLLGSIELYTQQLANRIRMNKHNDKSGRWKIIKSVLLVYIICSNMTCTWNQCDRQYKLHRIHNELIVEHV